MPRPVALRLFVATLGLALSACGDDTPPPQIEEAARPPQAAAPEPEPAESAQSAELAAELAANPRARGMWVLCEGSQRVLEDPGRVDAMIETALAMGVTDLFVQVYRGGRAWFDSSHADARPFEQMREALDFDPLSELLGKAEASGLRVHAWVNAMSLAGQRNPPIVAELGRGIVLVDQHGRSLLEYPKLEVPEPDRRYYRMGTPAVWIDPAAPGVAEYLARTFSELLVRYPGFAGLHLDYIRYPGVLPFAPGSRFGVGLDFGYGASTLARFREETGLDAPVGESTANANRWDQWRRDKLTELVATVREAARAVHPRVEVSAAVGSYVERVYLSESQDWQRWLEDGLIEFAVPMAYTLDDRMFRYFAERFANGPLAERIWLGHGSWLFAKRPAGALDQLRVAKQAGAVADVLFSYDSIADAPALREALVEEYRSGR